MSKKKSKVRKKVKNKQKQFKMMNDNFDEDVICQRKGCNIVSDNIVQLRVDEKKVTNVFLCKEHADELEYELAPEWLEEIRKELKNDDEIDNAELLVNYL
ncbi:hypothetical protein [Spiroplasma endosymbiont of Colias croceus]|uniref:hypothetical protein n=1 Tax=Spiroplasma endosymbiont of Colias croceus TaxID=3066310 RepID=UPI0030CB2142